MQMVEKKQGNQSNLIQNQNHLNQQYLQEKKASVESSSQLIH